MDPTASAPSVLRRSRALAAVGQTLLDAELADVLAFLTPERIAAQATMAGIPAISPEIVRYHFRDPARGVKRFDPRRLADALVEHLLAGFQPLLEPWTGSGAEPVDSRVHRLLGGSAPDLTPSGVGVRRLHMLLAAVHQDRPGPYRDAAVALEHRTQAVIDATFADRPETERAWLRLLLPTAMDTLAVARMLPVDASDVARLAWSTAGVVSAMATQLQRYPTVHLPPAPTAPAALHDDVPANAPGARMRWNIAALAFMALAEASLGDLLGFLRPSTVAARSGPIASRLQIARAFSPDPGAAFEHERVVSGLLGVVAAHRAPLSATAPSLRIDAEARSAGFASPGAHGLGWLQVAERMTWLSLVASSTDGRARKLGADQIAEDIALTLQMLGAQRPEAGASLEADAAAREPLALWAARLRRWRAPWEGEQPFAWLVAGGILVGLDQAGQDAAASRPVARAALAAIIN